MMNRSAHLLDFQKNGDLLGQHAYPLLHGLTNSASVPYNLISMHTLIEGMNVQVGKVKPLNKGTPNSSQPPYSNQM